VPSGGERVAIARLGRPHGVRGAIAAHSDGPTLGTLQPGDSLVAALPSGPRELVLDHRRGEAPRAILAFRGVATREDAAALTGARLEVPQDRLPPVDDPDTYYVRDLIGFTVHVDGRVLGTVREVHPGPANDALVVGDDGGEVLLLPFTRDAVVQVDVAGRSVVLRDGLL